MIRTNNFDDQEYNAFILDESRICTDDRELDEMYDEFSTIHLLDEDIN